MVIELAKNDVPSGVALAGVALLFETALRHLGPTLPVPTIELATCLARQLLAGIAVVLDTLGVTARRDVLVPDIVDYSRLRATLSRREAMVFTLLVEKTTTHEIADRLGINEITVKHHITSIGRKLGGQGRNELIRKARDLGILVTAPLSTAAALATLDALSAR